MIHMQQASQVQYTKLNTNDSVQKMVEVDVLNQMGEQVTSYNVSGLSNQKLGNKLQRQNEVIQVLVNGQAKTMNQVKDMTLGELGNKIVIMENANMNVNAQYNINGNNYVLSNTSLDTVTQTSARIYVPSNVLKNNTLTSVAINGINYDATVEGSYVIVKGNIPAISAEANKVTVNFQNNHTKPGRGVAQADTGKANVQVIIMNQYGTELNSISLQEANGFSLLNYFTNQYITGPVQSIQYNGKDATVMDLLSQAYVPGTSNILTIVEHTQSPLRVTASLFGRELHLPDYGTNKINQNGMTVKLPSGLARNFDVTSVTINGVQYKGVMNNGEYTVNAFIPDSVMYQVSFNLKHKVR